MEDSNRSSNPSIHDLSDPSRRTLLRGGLGFGLGSLLAPLGAASLAQVHRARRKSDGTELVLKVQYPGVAQAIDTDLSLVTQLLRVSKVVPMTREFEEWLDEVRLMMHREVNYRQEMETTRLFYSYLNADPRYIVPRIYSDYCTNTILISIQQCLCQTLRCPAGFLWRNAMTIVFEHLLSLLYIHQT